MCQGLALAHARSEIAMASISEGDPLSSTIAYHQLVRARSEIAMASIAEGGLLRSTIAYHQIVLVQCQE